MNARELKKLEQKCAEFTQKRDARLLKSLQEKLDKAYKIAESFPPSKIRKSTCSRKQNPEICQQLCKCNCVYGLALLIKSGYSISISEKIKYIITKGEPMEENKNTPETTVMSAEYSQAVQADALVESGFEMTQVGIAKVCKGVKLMHDGKLYRQLGFQNFEEYCQSKGFTKQYGNQLVRIAEMMEQENGNSVSVLKNLGVKKLYQLAMLNPEQREEVIQTVNVESVTVKELQSQISQMKTRQKHDAERITELTLEKEGIYQQMEAVQERIDGLEAEKKQAQERIKELESRPTEVYKDEKDQAEIERLTAENNQLKIENEALEEQRTELETKINELDSPLTSGENRHKVEAEIAQAVNNATKGLIAQNQSMQEQNQRDIQKIHQGYQKEIAELKKQIAEKSDIPEESPQMKAFKIRLATLADSIELLVKFLCENPEMSYLDKSGQVLKGAENSLMEIRKQVQG